MRIDGFHHAAVSVPDLGEAIRWYGDVLGFNVEREWTITTAGARVAYLARDAMRFEMFELAAAVPMAEARRNPRDDLKTHGHKHIAFSTTDYDSCRAAMIARGIEIVLEVGEQFGRGFFIRDPFGNVLELVETAG